MDFVTWVEDELRRRQWRAADLARHGKLTTAQISRVLSRQQNAGHAFCEGLARAFDLPKDVVYAKAGLGDPDPQPDQWARAMSHRLNRLPPELRNTERQEHEARRRSQEHQRAITSMQELLPHIRGWISGEDPLTVRFHLSRIITITAHPEKTVTVSLV